MNFAEAEQYLYSLGNEVLAMKLGLENITILLDALGNPQNDYLKIQIVGTNGKGSTCAFLQSILDEANIKNGMTTSPHLVSITERIKIDGVEISELEFADLATKIRETSEKLVAESKLENVPTYFEQVTAMALLAFSRHKVEIAILETGLGGRFDATTAAKAEIIGFTSIALDHQNILGETIEEITAEKAAAIHEDSTVIIGRQQKEVSRAILGTCRSLGLEPIIASENIRARGEVVDHYYLMAVSITTERSAYDKLDLGIPGRHQAENAAIAIAIAEHLQDRGYQISHFNLSLGLEKARHAGRLEWHDGLLLDGAHNIAGAKTLVEYLKEDGPYNVAILFGVMNDKNVADILEVLSEIAEAFIFTSPSNERALPPDQIKKHLPKEFKGEVTIEANLPTALNILMSRISEQRCVVTGSLYLIGEVKKILGREKS